MISFDAAHAAVHYPKDRRFRIWVRPSILIGIAVAVVSVILASWIEFAVAGLPAAEPLVRRIRATDRQGEFRPRMLAHLDAHLETFSAHFRSRRRAAEWR